MIESNSDRQARRRSASIRIAQDSEADAGMYMMADKRSEALGRLRDAERQFILGGDVDASQRIAAKLAHLR